MMKARFSSHPPKMPPRCRMCFDPCNLLNAQPLSNGVAHSEVTTLSKADAGDVRHGTTGRAVTLAPERSG